MIINIPLQIDEKRMEEVIQKDYQGKVVEEIVKYIKTALTKHSTSYYGDRELNGMTQLIREEIYKFLDSHKDDIINAAGNVLAEKLSRTKRGKALLDDVSGKTS